MIVVSTKNQTLNEIVINKPAKVSIEDFAKIIVDMPYNKGNFQITQWLMNQIIFE